MSLVGVPMEGAERLAGAMLRRAVKCGALRVDEDTLEVTLSVGALSHQRLIDTARLYMEQRGWGVAERVDSYSGSTRRDRMVPDAQSSDGKVVVECGRTQAEKVVRAVQRGLRLLWIPYPPKPHRGVVSLSAILYGSPAPFCWAATSADAVCGAPSLSNGLLCAAHAEFALNRPERWAASEQDAGGLDEALSVRCPSGTCAWLDGLMRELYSGTVGPRDSRAAAARVVFLVGRAVLEGDRFSALSRAATLRGVPLEAFVMAMVDEGMAVTGARAPSVAGREQPSGNTGVT